MLKIERVRHGGELLRIAPQHRHPGTFLALVVVTVQQIGRRTAGLTGAMSQNLIIMPVILLVRRRRKLRQQSPGALLDAT